MSKKSVSILICLSMMVPVLLWAGTLDKYAVPQKQSGSSVQPKATVEENVYIHFKQQVHNYPPAKKEEMSTYYRKKLKKAVRDGNLDAALHYDRLIAILNTN